MTPFNSGWRVERDGAAPTAVTLPHDAMLAEPRSPEAATRSHGGYFPGGRYLYSRRWTTPPDLEDRRATLVFEGVFGTCQVLLDGVLIGENRNGYTEFEVDLPPLRPRTEYEIRVVADNTAVPKSRWYTGSGIYRPVWLRLTDPVHLLRDGVRTRTTRITPTAQLDVDLSFTNLREDEVRVTAVLARDGEPVAEAHAVSTADRASISLHVPEPALWSAQHPDLYDLQVTLVVGQVVRDVHSARIGLRTIELDRERGLLVNGRQVRLRGGCVHHDNGVIGATTLAAAERRRVQILKQWGYNAVRSAHNPLSRAFLEACDELGMYVMDEYTDVWFLQKTRHGDIDFAARWPSDLAALVAKDRNHPSVIMYSIGNEIPETALPYGVQAARELTQFLHETDPGRPVTIGANTMLNGLMSLGKDRNRQSPPDADATGPMDAALDSTAVNILMNHVGAVMNLVARTPLADRGTRGVFDVVDVAGYNYGRTRMAKDLQRYPDRFVLSTESMPGDIAAIWSIVEDDPRALGDFSWTAWDYLGEAGLGVWIPGKRVAPLAKSYPYLTAGCGAIDITGAGGALAQLASATWRHTSRPLISVRPLDRSGRPVAKAAWRSTDGVPSWSWRGKDGAPAEVEVFSADDEVELLLDGRVIGRRPAGRGHGNVARFTLPYTPGELTAIAYRDGAENGRTSLRSSTGPLLLTARSDREHLVADGQDAAFIDLEITDSAGTVEQLVEDTIELSIDGPALLAGFGSAAPATRESFADHRHSTYRGRALAVVRATEDAGEVVVTATSARHGTARTTLLARRPHEDDR